MSGIQVTDAAFRRLQAIRAESGENCMLRVAVLGGGCSGFQYAIDLEHEMNKDDTILEHNGNCVLVDSISFRFSKAPRSTTVMS